MKKFFTYLPLCVLALAVAFQCASFFDNYKNPASEETKYVEAPTAREQYFRKINEIIKDLEFDTAKADDGKIVLYNNKYQPISDIPFAEYDKSIKFIVARKSDGIVYFTTGGSVDDESGIMFVNDGSDGMMNGLWRVDKIGGNAYEYNAKR